MDYTEKKKTKLKKMKITSVDMVHRGANQEAWINLYKSDNTISDAPGAPQSDDNASGIGKSIKEFVKGLMSQKQAQDDIIDETEPLTKAEEVHNDLLSYQEALNKSIDSIIQDAEIEAVKKSELIEETLEQFKTAYLTKCAKVLTEPLDKATHKPNHPGGTGEGEKKMRIDKSRFNEEERKMYDALIAKGLVDDSDPRYVSKADGAMPEEKQVEERRIEYEVDGDGKEMERADDEIDIEVKNPEMDKSTTKKACNTRKSAEMHPEVKKALDEVHELKKKLEIGELLNVAKKYEPIGKKADELAYTLYDMKKSGQANYDEYIALLDESLAMVQKSGVFEEIGKSGRGISFAGGSTVNKIEQVATEIQKSDPSLSRVEAVDKAWSMHPELIAEYEQEL